MTNQNRRAAEAGAAVFDLLNVYQVDGGIVTFAPGISPRQPAGGDWNVISAKRRFYVIIFTENGLSPGRTWHDFPANTVMYSQHPDLG